MSLDYFQRSFVTNNLKNSFEVVSEGIELGIYRNCSYTVDDENCRCGEFKIRQEEEL